MKLVVGLGNPGAKYERTRHNLGFWTTNLVAKRLGLTLDAEKFGALYGVGSVAGEKVIVMQPQRYMNLSGEAVGPAARFWKVEPRDVLVVHDDLDLEEGRVQLKLGGGPGGHNGLKSIIEHLGDGFARVRCGIGRPPPGWDPADFVLARMSPAEEETARRTSEAAADAVMAVLTEGWTKAINRVNRRERKEVP